MDKQEASKKISELIKRAHELIAESVRISEQSGVGFSWDFEYGMGGWYTPKSEWIEDEYDPEEHGPLDEVENDFDSIYKKWGWMASSQSC